VVECSLKDAFAAGQSGQLQLQLVHPGRWYQTLEHAGRILY